MLRLRAPPDTPLGKSIGSGDHQVNPEVMVFTPLPCPSCPILYNTFVLHLSAKSTYYQRGMRWPDAGSGASGPVYCWPAPFDARIEVSSECR